MDLLCIELIHLQNPTLWQEIHDNMKYFVEINDGIPPFEKGLRGDEIDAEKDAYIKRFFEDSNGKLQVSEYKDVLNLMFPHIGKDAQFTILQKTSGKRISDGFFFDTFFDRDKNLYEVATNKAEEFIYDIDSGELTVDNSIQWYTNHVKAEEWLEGFRESYVMRRIIDMMPNLSKDSLHEVCGILCKLYRHVSTCISLNDNVSESARKMIPRAILNVLFNIQDGDSIEGELKYVTCHYENLSLMRKVKENANLYKIQNDANAFFSCCDLIINAADSMLEEVVKEKINPYSKENYHRQNAVSLYKDERARKYLQSIISLSALSAPLVIADCIDCTKNSNDEFIYTIETELLRDLFRLNDNTMMTKILDTASKWPDSELVDIIKNITESYIADMPVYADGTQSISPFHHAGGYISPYKLDLDGIANAYLDCIE